jgi:hypothetical protein
MMMMGSDGRERELWKFLHRWNDSRDEHQNVESRVFSVTLSQLKNLSSKINRGEKIFRYLVNRI